MNRDVGWIDLEIIRRNWLSNTYIDHHTSYFQERVKGSLRNSRNNKSKWKNKGIQGNLSGKCGMTIAYYNGGQIKKHCSIHLKRGQYLTWRRCRIED